MPFLAPTLGNADAVLGLVITPGFYPPPHRGGGSRPSYQQSISGYVSKISMDFKEELTVE